MYRVKHTVPRVTEEQLAEARVTFDFLEAFTLYPIPDEVTALQEARLRFVPDGPTEYISSNAASHSVELSPDGKRWLVTLTIVGD